MIDVDPVLIKVLKPDTWVEITYIMKDPDTGEMDEDFDEGFVHSIEKHMLFYGDEGDFGYEGWIVQGVHMRVDV